MISNSYVMKGVAVPSEPAGCCIFLGNLSILCNEQNLYEIFSPFGPISAVRLKKSEMDSHRAHLSYGFIDFCSPESAERALVMNNTMFFGRVLRVGRAEDYDTRRHHRDAYHPPASIPPVPASAATSRMSTAQVHVSFTCHDLTIIVSEVTLREIFGEFGHLVDVVIKKNVAHVSVGLQSGYGFVHYGLDEKGIESALRAVEIMNHRNIKGVVYECSLTHGLKTYLLALRKKENEKTEIFQQNSVSRSNPMTPEFSSIFPLASMQTDSFHSSTSANFMNHRVDTYQPAHGYAYKLPSPPPAKDLLKNGRLSSDYFMKGHYCDFY